jgi:hypothetical protein
MVVSSTTAPWYHGAVMRRIVLLASVGFWLVACGIEGQRQWYKPNENYTVAGFERDQAACTRARVLDEECMKQRGWQPLSADRERPTATTAPSSLPRGGARSY